MGKILAIILVVVVLWFGIPKIAQAQWFAPTLYPRYWWGSPVYDYQPQSRQQGYGWFNLSFWNGQPSVQAGYSQGWNTWNPGTVWGGGAQTLPYYTGAASAYGGFW